MSSSNEEPKRDLTIELGDKQDNGSYEPPRQAPMAPPATSVANSPPISILAYCGSSILMTVTNKIVLTGTFNLNFFLLAVQSIVCIIAIQTLKLMGIAQFRDFNTDEARKWFPISLLLIGMIYTGSKALQFLSIPVYTIFKNLTIILIAYGEVIWFGGSVTSMTLLSFGLMVVSSLIAAWADIQHALTGSGEALTGEAAEKLSTLNAGYLWMLCNCFCSAAYVLGMRKRIKLTNFKDFDTMYYNNLLSIPVLLLCSLFLENWSAPNIAINFPAGHEAKVFAIMVISGLSSVFISYSSAWCVRVTSSTTYSMVGALNKLPIALSGLIFFDAPATFASVGAIFVGFVSGVVYAVAKMWQSKNKAQTAGVLPTTSASVQSMRDSLKQ
nr:GDP-mannose transporter 1 [Rachicladosporium sp. CCFEE 5018]